ncbi:uncharacterized protein LOC127290451 [Leptopilina boulardi]|uniref:uncharacterized protein LOC127290451 n=1 Tax=Leptopilina boulardi TaxID=63433 RepID=UPI0021F58E10|nr:uncharacterized protein LOC127290451 [Leptopilina boulardi]
MDVLHLSNPIASVQLIPIFNYLNLLSDFLFAENYLHEIQQYQQIEIVNSLYDYLEDYNDNKTMQMKLIRNLLRNSDLYGEANDEEVDKIFINSMFHYIVSSLVFEKYGNIYGFLAETIRNVESINYEFVLKIIKKNLENAKFQNENGIISSLNQLSVNAIYSDIILPIFPKSKTNLSILSLDYIFAQAGSTYLRFGRINDFYSFNFENNNFRYFQENLFDEYLIIGHIISNLFYHKQIDPITLRVFALPALLYYTTTEDKVKNETIRNIIFSPHHWKTAYNNFLEYVVEAFDQIEDQLRNDYTYKIHVAFSHFQSRASIAKYFIDSNCRYLSETQRERRIYAYVQHGEQIECKSGFFLPTINNSYNNQIYQLGELYGNYDLRIMMQYFNESLIEDFYNIKINLLVANDQVLDSLFKNSDYLSYDLLEFVYTNNKTLDYYALIRRNYSVELTKETDDPEFFLQQVGPSLGELLRPAKRITLKFPEDSVYQFCEELMKYKKERFKSYLSLFDYNLQTNEWWKEFGLSLVPYYPCLSNVTTYSDIEKNVCEKENFKFFQKFTQDISLQIVQKKTQTFLSSFGTTIKSVFVKDMLEKTVEALVMPYEQSKLSSNIYILMDKVYETLSLHIEEPKYETLSITQEGIKSVRTIITDLKTKLNRSFKTTEEILNNINILNNKFIIGVNIFGRSRKRTLFTITYNNKTSYGYRFIITDTSDDKTKIALMRTGYELKDKIFIIPGNNSSEIQKIYTKLNFENMQSDYSIYEINNQLRKKSTKVVFSGISNDNVSEDKCMQHEYLDKTVNVKNCLRIVHYNVKRDQIEDLVELLKNKLSLDGVHVASEEQIRDKLKIYTFPDDKTFTTLFAQKWLSDTKFEESDWSKSCLIENPDLLNKLRYDVLLENNNVTIPDGKYRISSSYAYRERCKIEKGTSIENIINDFNEREEGFSVSFEDYYAIRNFAMTGHERITADTSESRLMKLALYKLAIRQSDDLREKYDWTLYRFESKPAEMVTKKLCKGKRIILQQFTSTSTSIQSALRFGVKPASGFRNILYKMKFVDPYFRAKIKTKVDQFEPINEMNVILLPGSEFEIENISIGTMREIDHVFIVIMTFNTDNSKHNWYKHIMSHITEMNI